MSSCSGPNGDPFTQEIRYVGQTFAAVRDRLIAHLSGRQSRSKGVWLDDLKSRGARPLAEVIDCVDDSMWKARETWWIEYLSSKCRLVNEHRNVSV